MIIKININIFMVSLLVIILSGFECHELDSAGQSDSSKVKKNWNISVDSEQIITWRHLHSMCDVIHYPFAP